MLNKRRLSHPLIVVAIVSLCSLFSGCNSADSSSKVERCENGCPGQGGEGAGPASYTDPVDYASIDQSNVQSLVGGAFVSSQFTPPMAERSATQDLRDLENDNLRTLQWPIILGDSAGLIDLSSPAYGSRPSYKGARTAIGTENGSCGGRFEFILKINEAKREFNGRFTYSKFCDQGVSLSGKADVQGTYDKAGQIRTIDFIFSNLSDDRLRMAGDITIEYTDVRIEYYLDFYAEDQGAGKIRWINQYDLYIYEFSDHVEFEFYGKYHDPDYGYVEVATSKNFRLYGNAKWPSVGSLLIQGQNNVSAELIAIDGVNCVIKADLDGDDLLDFESDILNWENLAEGFAFDPVVDAAVDLSLAP